MSDHHHKQHSVEVLKPNQHAKHQHQHQQLETSDEGMIVVPKEILRRVNALKNIQHDMLRLETRFYEELHQLECKYASLYEPLYEKRQQIVNGEYEPSDKEAIWALDETEEDSLANELMDKAKIEPVSSSSSSTSMSGIPEFWLQTLRSTDLVSEMIQEHDEPVLKHLRDIRVKMHSSKPYGYTLEFHFAPNEFFSNQILTKSYELSCDLDERDPLGYDGPMLYKCSGTQIQWLSKEKNVTCQLVKKKQKHKSSGTIRTVIKEEKQDSFFNFFETPTSDGIRPSYKSENQALMAKDISEDLYNEEKLCEADFEIGHFFKELIVPKAILYFTGELSHEDDEDDEYDEEDEDDEEGDEEEDDIDEEDEEEEEAVEEEPQSKSKSSSKKTLKPSGKNK